MDTLRVSDARLLLQGALSASSAKETELQLMVGSRYHELIESADAIVTMHSTATELRLLLQRLPQTAQVLLQPPVNSATDKATASPAAGADPSAVYRLALVRRWTHAVHHLTIPTTSQVPLPFPAWF